MVSHRAISRHGARRFFTVIAVGLLVLVAIKVLFDPDLSRGSPMRYVVFGTLAILSAGALEVWRRVRG